MENVSENDLTRQIFWVEHKMTRMKIREVMKLSHPLGFYSPNC